MSELEHSEDIQDLTAELKRREMAYKFMAQQLAQHIEVETRLGAALDTAMLFIDQLLSDLRVAGGTPSQALLARKLKFDETIEKLRGRPRDPDRADPDGETSA